MNIEYLKNELIPKRNQEIEDGENLATANPIYIVLDLNEKIVSGHDEYLHGTNLKGKKPEYGYIDLDDSLDRDFVGESANMKDPVAVTRFWIDSFEAFFLTSGGAHDYLKYQSHNLSKEAYVYVFNAGYGNREMGELLKNYNKNK